MNIAGYVLNKINEVVTDPYSIKEQSITKVPDAALIKSSELLSLYEVDGYYDLYLTNPHATEVKFRLFHLSVSKQKEAYDLFYKFNEKLVILCKCSNRCYVTSILQNICSLIRTRSIWSPAHIAVEAGLNDVYNKESLLSQWINSQSCELHYTPLHIACQLNDNAIVISLIDGGADLSKQDDKGNTVLHLAININAEKVISSLLNAASKKVLTIENAEGETALHIAAKLDKHSMCKVLLTSGASPFYCGPIAYPIHYALKYQSNNALNVLLEFDFNQVKLVCKKHGGIPLHWCKTKEQVNMLYKFQTPTDVLSCASHLPLHIMILRGRLEAAVAIILGSAKVNGKGMHGNTALHLAVLHNYVLLVKMLLIFGADHNILNDFGENPGVIALHSQKPNKESLVKIFSSIGGMSIMHAPLKLASKQEYSKSHFGYKVLCLDGGGIRGLISVHILMAIEKVCGKQAKHLFDWIAGTSTGGVLALASALGKDAIEVQRLYFRLKDKVFVGSRPYSAEPFEEFLKQEFGETTTMENISHGPKVLVTTTLADRKPMQLHLFKNYEDNGVNSTAHTRRISRKVSSSAALSKLTEKVPSLKQPLWKVARCSGSAPTYFRPMDNFLDGGLIANNPTLDTLTEIHRYCQQKTKQNESNKHMKEIGVVVSIGTGNNKITVAGYTIYYSLMFTI